MKRSLIVTIIIISAFFKTSGQEFNTVSDAWSWYKSLDQSLQDRIAWANDSKKIKKSEILDFLPIRKIDVAGLRSQSDLEFLKDMTELEQLRLPRTITDYSLFEKGHFSKIKYLSIEGQLITSKKLKEFKIDSLRSINIRKTRVDNLDFVLTFPYLKLIQVGTDQFSRVELKSYQKLSFSTPEQPILLRENWMSEDYFNYVLRDLNYPEIAVEKKVSGKVVVNAFIDPDGIVEKVEALTKFGYGLEEEVIRLVKKVRFEKIDSSNGVQELEMTMLFILQ